MRSYIGGDRLSFREREERYLSRLRGLPRQHEHWPFQCRCGTLGWVVYRGRNYCPRCGRRWRDDPQAGFLPWARRSLLRSGCEECVSRANPRRRSP